MSMNLIKDWFEAFAGWTHLSPDALMIFAGMIIFFIIAACHQRQLKSNYALWAVIGIALAWELFGARHDILDKGYWRIGDSLRDILTMSLLPLLLWLTAKRRVWKW